MKCLVHIVEATGKFLYFVQESLVGLSKIQFQFQFIHSSINPKYNSTHYNNLNTYKHTILHKNKLIKLRYTTRLRIKLTTVMKIDGKKEITLHDCI